MTSHIARSLLACCLLQLLAGCGFQLRSWDLSSSIDSFYVQAAANNPLEQPLRRGLLQAGVPQADSAASAAVVVTLHELRRSRRGVSVTPRSRVAEYELNLDARFGLRAADKELLASQWARASRVFRVDRDNLVASNEEQALLEREMRADLVQQILRALNAVTAVDSDAA
ncbi:MAG: hypothetical protein CMQ49_03565 [Gammaproteobacteria bacterium]|nr:hypothetical protein [Gammaproteobacteria bacterium]